MPDTGLLKIITLWQQHEINLSEYISQYSSLNISFEYSSSSSTGFGGAYLDDFEVVYNGSVSQLDDVESGPNDLISTLVSGYDKWRITELYGGFVCGVFKQNHFENSSFGFYVTEYSQCSLAVINNTFITNTWVADYSSYSSFYNNSVFGNRYYLLNGTGSWGYYNISSSQPDVNWADLGSDLPFNSSLLSAPPHECYQESVDDLNCRALDTGSVWGSNVNNQDYIYDRNWSTGGVASTNDAYFRSIYVAPIGVVNATLIVKGGTSDDNQTFVLSDECIFDYRSGPPAYKAVRIGYFMNLSAGQISVVCYTSEGGVANFALGTIEGGTQLFEDAINWTIAPTVWLGSGNDWHPYSENVAQPNVFGNGSNINASSSLTNITVIIGNNTNVNGTLQQDVKTVNITNASLPLLLFSYNFTNSQLNFSDVSIESGSTSDGKSYASVSGINSSNIVGTKTLYMQNANTAINSVCVKDEEGAIYSAISSTCSGINEHLVLCDGATHSGYTCTFSGTTAIITGLTHSAAIQFSSSSTTTTTTYRSGSVTGGGEVFHSYTQTSSKESQEESSDSTIQDSQSQSQTSPTQSDSSSVNTKIDVKNEDSDTIIKQTKTNEVDSKQGSINDISSSKSSTNIQKQNLDTSLKGVAKNEQATILGIGIFALIGLVSILLIASVGVYLLMSKNRKKKREGL